MPKDAIPSDISPALRDEILHLLVEPVTPEEDEKIRRAMRATPTKTFGKGAGSAKKSDRTIMVSLRLNDKTNQAVRYWSEKRELTVTEYITDAILEKIARENGDYDLPTLEQIRLAQLIDEIKTLSVTVNNLEKALTSMIESIAVMARNPSYMSESLRSLDDA